MEKFNFSSKKQGSRCVNVVALLVVLVGFSGCAKVFTDADNRNPCSNKYDIECELWRKQYPKEYARYKERMMKNSDSKLSARKRNHLADSLSTADLNH
jgi:hypothetical protein